MADQTLQQKPGETQSQQQNVQSQSQQQQKPGEQQQQAKPGEQQQQKPSIYADLKEADPGTAGATVFPDNWREQLATGDDGKVDEKQLGILKRYNSPKEYHKSAMAARQRITSGEYRKVGAPPEGDEAALATWREEQGIPKSADGYELPIPQGVEFEKLDENTKASIKGFQEAFHKGNLAAPQAKVVTEAIVSIAEKQLERQAQGDAQNQETCEDALRAELGGEYRTFLATNWAYLEKTYGDDAAAVLTARTEDGRRLSDIPAFNKAINDAARASGGDIVLTHEDGGAKGGTVEGRIAEIKKIMDTDFNRYQREGLSEEYGKLLARQEARGKLVA